jgi:hypothetical protein
MNVIFFFTLNASAFFHGFQGIYIISPSFTAVGEWVRVQRNREKSKEVYEALPFARNCNSINTRTSKNGCKKETFLPISPNFCLDLDQAALV